MGSLVLWDIDGTILRGGGIGLRSMLAAFREVLGDHLERAPAFDLDRIPFHGNTDPAIIGSGLELAGIARHVHDELIATITAAYLRAFADEMARKNPFRRLPGVLELVDALGRAGFHQGLGTGNVEAAAWIKVGAVELGDRFAFGGFGSDARDRGELLRIGRDRGAGQLGVPASACRVVVIGDTLQDIAAARAIGAEVLAVASGGDSLEALRAAGPDHLFESLADPAVVAALTAPTRPYRSSGGP